MLHLEAQAYFDKHGYDPADGYTGLTERDQKIRHILLHTAKAAMKLVERDEGRVISEVIPDTSIYRSQLINLLGDGVKSRVVNVLDRGLPITLTGDDGWNIDFDANHHDFLGNIVKAGGRLATYAERREHGEAGDEDQLRLAIINLDWGSRGLAALYDVDAAQLHINRLEQNLGSALPSELKP